MNMLNLILLKECSNLISNFVETALVAKASLNRGNKCWAYSIDLKLNT